MATRTQWATRGVAILAATTLAASLAACSTGDTSTGGGDAAPQVDPITLSYATNVGELDHGSVAMKWWMDRVTELSDGQITFEAFWSESLCKTPDLLACAGDGRADITPVSPAFDQAAFPLGSIVLLPYATENVIAVAQSLTEMYRTSDALQAEYNAQNVHLLHAIPTTTAVMGSREPVTSLADIQGKSMRGYGMLLNALDKGGANAVAVPIGEVYESLDRGVIDGWFATTLDNSVLDFKLNEVTPYITDTGAGAYQAGAILLNLDRWNGLSAEQQAILSQASDEVMGAYGEEFLFPLYERVCDAVEAEGVTLSAWSDKAKAEWRDIVSGGLKDEWSERAAATGVDAEDYYAQYHKLLDKYEAAGDVPTGITYCLSRG
ncbi:TRAP transporter substrate-binding protein DctP [Salinibacterium sp. ZJ77]|uniref:TRAP transporter substrate-binding protein DctP n=1 Tax=Salinibacterium sp. ZJ77 TaxID=2708337 RepID=UPI00142169E6|nr:TRAP transporter substrate-binding protein DctP [Salinibacterium sp. ZJ77]